MQRTERAALSSRSTPSSSRINHPEDQARFYSISLGSLRECQAILELGRVDNLQLLALANRLGAMLFKHSIKPVKTVDSGRLRVVFAGIFSARTRRSGLRCRLSAAGGVFGNEELDPKSARRSKFSSKFVDEFFQSLKPAR